jgi:hypothetical protein
MYRNTTIARTVLSNEKYLPPCYCAKGTEQYATCYPHPRHQLNPVPPRNVFYESDGLCTVPNRIGSRVNRSSIAYR